jgi:hypothetical protein
MKFRKLLSSGLLAVLATSAVSSSALASAQTDQCIQDYERTIAHNERVLDDIWCTGSCDSAQDSDLGTAMAVGAGTFGAGIVLPFSYIGLGLKTASIKSKLKEQNAGIELLKEAIAGDGIRLGKAFHSAFRVVPGLTYDQYANVIRNGIETGQICISTEKEVKAWALDCLRYGRPQN